MARWVRAHPDTSSTFHQISFCVTNSWERQSKNSKGKALDNWMLRNKDGEKIQSNGREFSLKTRIMAGGEKNEVDEQWKGNGALEKEGDFLAAFTLLRFHFKVAFYNENTLLPDCHSITLLKNNIRQHYSVKRMIIHASILAVYWLCNANMKGAVDESGNNTQ